MKTYNSHHSPIARVVVSNVVGLLFAASANAASFDAGDTKVNLGGYIKFDATYADPGVSQNGTVVSAATVGTLSGNAAKRDHNVDFSARESRFWIKTSTPSSNGGIKTHIEGDFYGSGGNEVASNSYGLRLRHAYGQLDRWLLGQTWSTFMDTDHLGEIIDFGQHTSTIFARQAQVRYTLPLDSGSLMFAAENPESLIVGAPAGTVNDSNSIPDLIARYNVKGAWGQASAAVMLRELKFDNGATSDEALGLASSLTGRFKVGQQDDVRVQLNAGALGRYAGLALHPGATIDAKGDVDILNSYGASLAYRHVWAPGVRSTLMLSATEADVSVGSGLVESSASVHLNVLWDVTKTVRMGIEAQRVDVDLEGSSAGTDLNRVQFSARYIF